MPLTADNDNLQSQRGQRCPNCGKTSVLEFRPFCSSRCKDIDLAHWLGGFYAIPCHNVEADSSYDADVPSDTQEQFSQRFAKPPAKD